jgi:hypothetical protein
MFTRTVTFTEATDIDAGAGYVQETVVPLLRDDDGIGFRVVPEESPHARFRYPCPSQCAGL